MKNRKRLTIENLFSIFEIEYRLLTEKFVVHNIALQNARENLEVSVNSPGIYVYWREDLGVIKVGKSQSNSRKRALQHIRDNTRNNEIEMRHLEGDKEVRLILFNVIEKSNVHWLLSLEAFLEWNSNPIIPTGRIG